MAIGRTALTDRDYAALPDDGRRDQILDGALEVTPAPSPDHQDVLANLHAVVRDHVKIHGRGRAFVEVLSPSTAALDRGVKSRLYARHGVAYDWIVDVDARAVDADELTGGAYRLAVRGQGQAPIDLPPFERLGLVPDSLWPRDSER